MNIIELKTRRYGNTQRNITILSEVLRTDNSFIVPSTDENDIKRYVAMLKNEGINVKYEPVYEPFIKSLFYRRKQKITGYKIYKDDSNH